MREITNPNLTEALTDLNLLLDLPDDHGDGREDPEGLLQAQLQVFQFPQVSHGRRPVRALEHGVQLLLHASLSQEEGRCQSSLLDI